MAKAKASDKSALISTATKRRNFIREKAENALVESSPAWSVDQDSEDFWDLLFDGIKTKMNLILRKFDEDYVNDVLKHCNGKNEMAIITILADYHDNTEMKQTKYTQGGFIKFKNYYTEVLQMAEVEVE